MFRRKHADTSVLRSDCNHAILVLERSKIIDLNGLDTAVSINIKAMF